MQTITFSYRNREYAAQILSSTFKEPYFHWLMFDDPELLRLTGGDDSVTFQEIAGKLVCTSIVLSIKCPDLITVAKDIIETYLKNTLNG